MDRTRITRRGFVTMLASVPILVVALPRIFLPERPKLLLSPACDLNMFGELGAQYGKYGNHPYPGSHAHLRHILGMLGVEKYRVHEDTQVNYSVDIYVPAHHVTQHTINALEYCRCPGVRFNLGVLNS